LRDYFYGWEKRVKFVCNLILIYPWVKIWHDGYTKKVFINLIDTLREGWRDSKSVMLPVIL